jgi:hypothetical protein
MGDLNATVAAWGGLGGFVAAVTLLGPLRAMWRKGHLRRVSHRLDHEGRPARVDPSTGRVIEPAQPGIASMIGDIHAKQADIGAKVATLVDNSGALTEIHQMLTEQKLVVGRLHAENRAENAEIRTQVVELRSMAQEAATQAKDAAGHAARIDRQQAELQAEIKEQRDEHMVIEQAYVRALSELGVAVEWPPPDRP